MPIFDFFGSKKEEPTPEEAMNKLRETEQMLTKKSEYIESQIQDQVALAKKHGMKNKKLALKALKKKRLLEAQQDKIGMYSLLPLNVMLVNCRWHLDDH